MNKESLAFMLHPDDNVAIVRNALAKDTVLVDFHNLVLRADIPAAHKLALAQVAVGQPVFATVKSSALQLNSIEPGEHVHTHNLAM